jgi:glutathione peroxidase
MTTLHDFEVRRLDGSPVSLGAFRGQVVLVVNTASQCGFTPQLGGLEALHARFQERGFAVLGFPCNQFGGQEPGSAEEIGSFCQRNYGVSFPMMAKTEVNGAGAHPVWQWLKANAPGADGAAPISWNFAKFLVGRDGQVRARYAPGAKPDSLAADIEAALAA